MFEQTKQIYKKILKEYLRLANKVNWHLKYDKYYKIRKKQTNKILKLKRKMSNWCNSAITV